MIINNLKVTLRSLWKNKVSSAINLFGLTVGLTSCLLISLYIQHEASFDSFQKNGSRIARVIMEYGFDGSPETKRGNFTSTKVAPEFSRTFPEVQYGIRMTDRDMIIQHNDNLVTEPYFVFADSTFFKIFLADLLQGNPAEALNGPFKVVLTESTAKKYFGNESPMGKILLTGSDEVPYEVTGVIQDYPSNSQIRFDFLASFCSLGENQEVTYFDANYTTYLLLKDEHAFTPLQEKITSFIKKEMAGSGASINFLLEPFDKIHLHSEYSGFVPNTSITYLYILSGVALLILVIVSFTYINLSTARSIERSKEVGIRKSIGANRIQLFWQFISESVIICLTAVGFSFLLIFIILPYFNLFVEKELPASTLFSLPFMGFSILVALVISLAAGSYPAIILSGFQPVKVLKGITRMDSGKWIQPSLIVFQFAISVFLIVATLVIQNQLYFIQHKKLGYERDHIIVLPMREKILDNLSVIKTELKANPNIMSVSRCVSTPVKIAGGYNMRSASMGEHEQHSVTASPIDEDYIKTTGLEIIAGTDLIEQDTKDVSHEDREDRTYHFILNESAARDLGWSPEQAVGKKMFMDHREGFVRGVIRDFHFESMHQEIKPLVLFTELRGHGNLLVKVKGQDLSETISFLETKWKQLVPYVPFEYHFLDDDYNSLYRSELQLGTVMNLFSGIAIILACLGLFGLSTFIVQQRIKEIGIRKILGASLTHIVGLVSGKFTMLVTLSIFIASPLAYLLMSRWLQGFVYRTEISGWTFALAAVSALAIAFLTVSVQGVKAALTNPAETLKSE
jgi:putative ABC transport system permease protein